MKFQRRQADLLLEDVAEVFCVGKSGGVADLKDLHVCLQEQLFGALDARKLQVIAEADALFLMEQTAEIDLGQADMVADERHVERGIRQMLVYELLGQLDQVIGLPGGLLEQPSQKLLGRFHDVVDLLGDAAALLERGDRQSQRFELLRGHAKPHVSIKMECR